jgi:hypothetical protein
MSLQGIQELDQSWTLRNQLTINNDVEVLTDLNTTGFIFGGGIPVNILSSNNIWSGKNTYTISLPTYLDPVDNDEMATKNYLDTAVVGLGSGLLPTANNWIGINKMTSLPTILNNATVGTNEFVNKGVADAYIGGDAMLSRNGNIWSAQENFTNVVSVPTPTVNTQFANKKYVDDSISAFNSSGGKIEYVELFASGLLSCDPAIYSGCMICLVSGGGYGANTDPPVITGVNIKSFGGSGAYSAFKLPAFQDSVQVSITNNTLTTVGNTTFRNNEGNLVCELNNGTNASNFGSGAGGGGVGYFTGIQLITGSSEAVQSPITNDAITKSYNICVLNGMGNGGSFNYLTGANVDPSGGYCLQIKYKI